jgi:hypothetical protein
MSQRLAIGMAGHNNQDEIDIADGCRQVRPCSQVGGKWTSWQKASILAISLQLGYVFRIMAPEPDVMAVARQQEG